MKSDPDFVTRDSCLTERHAACADMCALLRCAPTTHRYEQKDNLAQQLEAITKMEVSGGSTMGWMVAVGEMERWRHVRVSGPPHVVSISCLPQF